MPQELLRTIVVGSYTRPSWLVDGIRQHRKGNISEDQLRELQGQAKLLTIKEMEDAGVDVISDGEQGRTSFYEYLTEQLTGFTFDTFRPFADGSRNTSLRRAVDKVALKGEIAAVQEASFLKSHTSRRTKVAVISPNFLADYWKPGGYYKSRDSFLEDMLKVSREEAGALSGKIDYVQWDAPGFTQYTDPKIPRSEASSLIRREVQVLNGVLQSVSYPQGTVKAVHLCWGNYRSMHQRDGPLGQILPELLELKADLLLVELASARHEDDVEAFKEYRTKKMIGAGVVDVKTPDVEPVWLIKKRVQKLVKYINPEKLLLSTDCGFAPSWDFDRIPRTSCFLKLHSMARAAEELRSAQS